MSAQSIGCVIPFERPNDTGKDAKKKLALIRGAIRQYGSDNDYAASLATYIAKIVDTDVNR